MKLQGKITFTNIALLLTASLSGIFVIVSVYLYAYEIFRPTMGLVCALAMLLPRMLYHMSKWKPHVTLRAVSIGELILDTLLLLNGLGALGLYITTQYYDFALHTISPFLGGIALSVLYGSYLISMKKYSLLLVQKGIIPICLFLIVLWELWEFAGDQVFGTAMFGQAGEMWDTYLDIGAGFCMMLLVYLFNKAYLKKIVVWTMR